MKIHFAPAALLATLIFTFSTNAGAADREKLLYSFSGISDGYYPDSGLVADSAGNLYGTTYYGGSACSNKGCGTVFELSPTSSGGWTKTVLYEFTDGADGGYPTGDLVFDGSGNLYGEAHSGGGPFYSGAIFQLSPNSTGGWTESVVYSFSGDQDGALPYGGLTFDAAGNLYGTTVYGGLANSQCAISCGTVFELSPSHSGGWTESTVYSFTGANDGYWPLSNLTLDANGQLYGTTSRGGRYDDGVVYRLAPSAAGWRFDLLYTFKGQGGYGPQSGVVLDRQGNLYGTAMFSTNGYGLVYKLAPANSFQWKESVLYRFTNGNDGSWPTASLIIDASGNLYGTTVGFTVPGTAYKITRSQSGHKFQLLHSLGQCGAPLLRDKAGNLFGTTEVGGQKYGIGYGSIFELSPVAP